MRAYIRRFASSNVQLIHFFRDVFALSLESHNFTEFDVQPFISILGQRLGREKGGRGFALRAGIDLV